MASTRLSKLPKVLEIFYKGLIKKNINLLFYIVNIRIFFL